jgi:4'-phosphopantetheinyl transferase
LGRSLQIEPREIQFVAGAQGKPAIAGGPEFNLAHSGDVALIALARDRAVGVDVEQVRAMPDADGIAARFFSAGEQAALAALPAAERQAAFFNIWTRKEAFIKATGAGLSFPLDGFTVSLGAGEDDCLLSAAGGPAVAARWRVQALSAPPGYAAAVAAEGRDWRLRLWGT